MALISKQEKFIQEYGSGRHRTAAAAAVAAGYSDANARSYAYKLLKLPKVRAELDKIAAVVREKTAFDATEAFAETERLKAAAEAAGQYQAAARFHEFSLKLGGQLIDRHEIRESPVDLIGALTDARARRALVRPLCDQEPITDGEFTDTSGACDARARDWESVAPRKALTRAPDLDA